MQGTTRGKEQESQCGSTLQTARLQESNARLFLMPLCPAPGTDSVPAIPPRHLRVTQLLKRQTPNPMKVLPLGPGSNLTYSQSRLRYFLPEDLPQWDASPHQWPLTRKVLRMKTIRLSEPRRRAVPEAAPLVSTGFPGKKVTRRPAIVGHLPEACKKRLLLTLTSGVRLSLE